MARPRDRERACAAHRRQLGRDSQGCVDRHHSSECHPASPAPPPPPLSPPRRADYILQLSGRAADPATLSQLVYIAANHDSRITHVDTVRAYHLGTNLLVEVRSRGGGLGSMHSPRAAALPACRGASAAQVDIVLPESTPLRVSHDIGESLQHEYEALPFVDRAFVHMDYEWKDHRADDEHAPV